MSIAKPVPGATPFIPPHATLRQLQQAVKSCEGCDLYRHATQVVFGEGRTKARFVLIGEQPGDKEDLAGHPFVGPAGLILDKALAEAGIDRSDVYLTNAVKHFKFEERGKRRIHKKPSQGEVTACKPWLEAELAQLHPRVIVCLGAIAAQSVIGKTHRVLAERGKFFDYPAGGKITATVHPSSILRQRDSASRATAYELFVEDLKAILRNS